MATERLALRLHHSPTPKQIGNTWLAKDSDGNGYAQPNGSSQQIRVTLNGQHVGDNSFSGWTMRGAEKCQRHK